MTSSGPCLLKRGEPAQVEKYRGDIDVMALQHGSFLLLGNPVSDFGRQKAPKPGLTINFVNLLSYPRLETGIQLFDCLRLEFHLAVENKDEL